MFNKLLLLFLFVAVPFGGFGQITVTSDVNDTIPDIVLNFTTSSDSTVLAPDSVPSHQPLDSISETPPPAKSSDKLDAQIIYSSQDSIVFWRDGTGFLHGSGDVKYKNITLQADYIRVKMDSSLLYARGTTDSIGDVIGEPVFGEGESIYNSKEITYNLQTGKGYVLSAVTQQGEGYIVSERTKKTGGDVLAVAGAKFTTCDNHEHPHFYLRIKEGKVKPGSHIIAGPSQLYLVDVPLPFVIPFAFFPFTDQYSSGILMPTITDELSRGFGLVNGGYYFAISDFIDLEMRGEIYTKGTWGVSAVSSYLKRYRYTGNFNFSYREDVVSEKDMPDYEKRKNMSIIWTHAQDAKANPYRTFSANVNFSTSGYDRNNINNFNNPIVSSQNTKASSINFTQRFPRISLLNISGGINVSQQTRDSTITLQLPNISISYSRFFPLKRKNAIGKERWYEKISMSYSGSIQNSITTKEDNLFSSNFAKDWRNGFTHNIPVEASFNVLNYISVTPYFRYTERWNLLSIRKHYDTNIEDVVVDTLTGFHRNFNYSTGVSMQTRLYGFYIPVRAIFGDKIDRIRHVLTPSVSFNYNPDFAGERFGFYDYFIKTNVDGRIDTVRYSIYEGIGVGGPSSGRTGSINYSLSNNVEMKIRNDRDTTGKEPFKIITLIDQLYIGSGYNFMADSLNMSRISVQLRLKLGMNKTFSISGEFDPYMLERSGNSVNRVNKYTWNHGMFPRFLGSNVSHTISLNNETLKKIGQWLKGESASFSDPTLMNPEIHSFNGSGERNNDLESEDKKESSSLKKKKADLDNDGYTKIDIPWNLNFTYSINYRPSDKIEDYIDEKHRFKMKLTHNLSLSGNISLTSNWKISGNLFYDITEKKIATTNFNVIRNLHCWTMSANLVPFGVYKSYFFKIGVNASMLADLKYEQRNKTNAASNIIWY